jgi:hypothetical protein
MKTSNMLASKTAALEANVNIETFATERIKGKRLRFKLSTRFKSFGDSQKLVYIVQ